MRHWKLFCKYDSVNVMRLSHVSVPSQFFPCLFQHLFTIPGSTEVTGTKLSSCCLHLDGIPVNLRRRRRPHFQLAVDVDFSERDCRDVPGSFPQPEALLQSYRFPHQSSSLFRRT